MAGIDKIIGNDKKILWYDRKRYLGLPWSFSRYYLVENPGEWIKIYTNIGLFSAQTEETHCYRVDDVSVYQSLFDKMFNVGTIRLWCKNAAQDTIDLVRVKNPYKVRDLIVDCVESERGKKRMNFSEFQA